LPFAVDMVEIPKDCVLQWAGHAGYITERFSGLLARQALVDVTLICDEQKLRVHKLVLASNSIYFEVYIQLLKYIFLIFLLLANVIYVLKITFVCVLHVVLIIYIFKF